MTMNGVTVTGNSTEVEGESNCGGNGGGIYNDGDTLTINNSTILNNTATQGQSFCFSGNGGGIFVDFGTITLDQTTVRNNQALAQNAVPELGGGGIYNDGANLTIQNGSVIDSNQAVNASGGGIYYTMNLRKTLQLPVICDGPCPAPIITTNLVIQNSAITRNTALEDGGGIYRDQVMTLTNVTVSTNTATNGEGGGIYNSGGSACFSPPCTGTLINVTVANNTAPVAGGISAPDVNVPVNLKNTLLAQNTGGNCNPADPVAAFGTLKHNLSDDDTCANFLTDGGTDLNGQAANLGALGNNGGVTETHALQIPSPAIDAIAVSDCTQADGSTPLTVDQRQTSTVAAGTFSRPQDILGNGALCDIGAFEVQPAPAITVAPGSLSFQSTVGVTTAAQTVTITSTGVGPATLTSIGLTGGNAGLFAIASNTCGALPAVLKPGASCQLGITFTPNAGGTFSDANVVVGSNTPSNPNTVTLTGSAPLVPPPAPGFIYEGSGCSNMMGIPPSGSAAASLLLFAPAALNSFLKRRKK
ncbi:MAG: choice-of-anchor D domain-containing protein [bacterium]